MNKAEQWFNNVCAFAGDIAEVEPDATIDTEGESNADTEQWEAT